jgi:TetR/AcrR family transcriptional regulator, cholesterol catabolism regulator
MEVKERIKQKADELFKRYGIRSITMDEIANQLGISKKTIYQSFSDKDELVDEVITDLLRYNKERCNNARSRALNAIQEVFLSMEMLDEMFENMNPVILHDLERNHPQTFKKFQHHKYFYLSEVVKQNIEKGKSEELFRADINTEVAAKARLETMMFPFNQEIFPKSKFNLVELEKQLIEYYLFGMASLKGYKLILKYQQESLKSIAR